MSDSTYARIPKHISYSMALKWHRLDIDTDLNFLARKPRKRNSPRRASIWIAIIIGRREKKMKFKHVNRCKAIKSFDVDEIESQKLGKNRPRHIQSRFHCRLIYWHLKAPWEVFTSSL